YNEDWENNLNAYGWTYDYWEFVTSGPPPLAEMQAHDVVVWTSPMGYPCIGAVKRNVIGQYLDDGGRLFISGKDIGWDMNPGGTDPDPDPAWYQNYLKATYIQDDSGASAIEGVAGDPISGGVSSVPLNCLWPDVIQENGGAMCWEYDTTTPPNCAAVRYDESMGSDNYRLVYEAFDHEAVGTWSPPAIDPNRAQILDKSLIYLLGGDHPEVTLTFPTGGETLSGTEVITWTSVGASNIKVFYSANNGQAWNLLYEDPTGTATSCLWDTTLLEDGTEYKVKVLVTGIMNLTDFKTSGAFSISNGVDNTGPMVVGGSVIINPQPTETPNIATLTATITDVGRGNSNIAAAEYFIDTTGADGSGAAMSAVLPPFNDLTEDVTASMSSALPDGDHIIYVHGQDAVGNWGGFSSGIWVVVNPDPPTYDIDLSFGVGPGDWTFVSFPISATGNLTTVFNDATWGSDAPGDEITWDYMQWYDNLNKEWRSYSIYKPAP
ncbi:MAG: hypothetical protein KAX31_01555, partial [Thermoplasmata archaeon]|nr:hypothetical protein [Thermoplasmata archaeon]